MAQCRSCSADMRWVISERNGKPMPLDPNPVADGNLVVYVKNGESYARAATPEDRRLLRELFKSHFATCPQASSWRGNQGDRT